MGFPERSGYILLTSLKEQEERSMSLKDEPKLAARPEDPELECTDGGWDPYVTSLLNGAAGVAAPVADDDDQPVMSFSTTATRRGD
jgi:hypothetical protein